ncbi:MAG: hypothetical protein LH629_13085, partial [Ignavibacteria bacterium]|nr:hypothetical protein [Ignavibacteria bacterium]
MITVLFKNVGQGDSILVEWLNGSQKHFGIIDCNLYESRNPLLEELANRNIEFIDFIILSHLHY